MAREQYGKMSFSAAIIAGLRSLGIKDFDIDPLAIEGGLEGAFEAAKREGLVLDFNFINRNHFTYYAEDMGVLRCRSPEFDRYIIELNNCESARKVLRSLCKDKRDEQRFMNCSMVFLYEFEEECKKRTRS